MARPTTATSYMSIVFDFDLLRVPAESTRLQRYEIQRRNMLHFHPVYIIGEDFNRSLTENSSRLS